MASPAQADSNKNRRLDMTAAASLETRERLIRVDELQKSGHIDEAVLELLAVAAQYSSRAAPVKAVAVLRQAVRMKPDNPDVRMAYGEVLLQLRMAEDAAREYAAACQLLETAGRYGEWLEVLRRLLSMDQDNLHGRLLLAEALSRANRTQESAESFRALAELLLQRGEIDDWEKIAERLLFHDPADNTTAHDLALHYVRSGRHAEALAKLILCYEAVPNDAELLELIIDALEALGQPDKAAVICRELLRTYQRTGLQDEAEQALKRLYSLDPSDPEARTFMGVLEPEVAANTVIELDAAAPPIRKQRRPTSSMQSAHPAFDSDRTSHLAPPVQTVPTRRPSMRIPSEGFAQTAIARPTGPVPVMELGAWEEPEPPQGRPVQAPHISVPQTSRPSVQPQQRPMAKPQPSQGEAVRPVVTARPAVAPTQARQDTPPRAQPPAAKSSVAQAANPPAPTNNGLDWGDAPTRRPAQAPVVRQTHVQALDVLSSMDEEDEELPADNSWQDDDEADFDQVEDRTIVQDPREALMALGLLQPPANAPVAEAEPVASTRRRSNSLPRPRLARRVGTMTELPTAARDMSKDLSTLDFFIERGFYESAVALLDALQKRHPDHPELAGYRSRIERMARG